MWRPGSSHSSTESPPPVRIIRTPETNYPEDRHLTDFVVLWNTYKRIAAGFSADERSWVFEKAARPVYNV